jgi:hypothetical protein
MFALLALLVKVFKNAVDARFAKLVDIYERCELIKLARGASWYRYFLPGERCIMPDYSEVVYFFFNLKLIIIIIFILSLKGHSRRF